MDERDAPECPQGCIVCGCAGDRFLKSAQGQFGVEISAIGKCDHPAIFENGLLLLMQILIVALRGQLVKIESGLLLLIKILAVAARGQRLVKV